MQHGANCSHVDLPPSLAPLFGTSGPPPPESLRLADDTDTARPVYHFLAPANWMNDPQPIVYVQGRYHLFYEVRHPPSPQLHPPTQPTPCNMPCTPSMLATVQPILGCMVQHDMGPR